MMMGFLGVVLMIAAIAWIVQALDVGWFNYRFDPQWKAYRMSAEQMATLPGPVLHAMWMAVFNRPDVASKFCPPGIPKIVARRLIAANRIAKLRRSMDHAWETEMRRLEQ